MATVSEVYDGSAVTLVTTALDSLASGSWWQSAAVDNTNAGTPSASISDNALEIQLHVTVVFGAVSPAAGAVIEVYAYGSTDGTNYDDAITGSQGTFTADNPTQLKLIGVVPTPSGSRSYKGGPFGVSKASDGWLPRKWGVAIRNNAGVAISTGNAVIYQALKQQVV